MNKDTYEKLRKMRLPEMAAQYRMHSESPELYTPMTFDEEFTLLVDAEFDSRKTNKIKRLFFASRNSSILQKFFLTPGGEFFRPLQQSFCVN